MRIYYIGVVDGRGWCDQQLLETKETKYSKVTKEYPNQNTKANQQHFRQHQDERLFLLSPVPFHMLWSFSS